MQTAPKIFFTVINDLNFDQRMFRICSSLQKAGYEVTLIGREHTNSQPLIQKGFHQKRLKLKIAKQGKLMYILYWLKLFFYLLTHKADLICAIDLDTIIPVYLASKLKGIKRVYDAHELFTEMKEVVSRPKVKKLWDAIERAMVPQFPNGYTIGPCYAEEFHNRYGVNYEVIRNATILSPLDPVTPAKERYILYQGWVNEGRCFEELIPAMQWVKLPLMVCGEGNFFNQAKELASKYGVTEKISFKGYIPPKELIHYTEKAYIGITLFQGNAKSNFLSMANRFFDYMHKGIPQICMNFPEYQGVNQKFEIATLITEPLTPEKIAEALNKLTDQKEYHDRLSANCLRARETYCWQNEEQKLLKFYQKLLPINEF